MKRTIAILLSLILVVSCVVALVACDPKDKGGETVEQFYWGGGKEVASSDRIALCRNEVRSCLQTLILQYTTGNMIRNLGLIPGAGTMFRKRGGIRMRKRLSLQKD